MKTSTLDLRRMDCMDLMREFPDGHFDLAIVDPPYGIGMDGNKANFSKHGSQYRKEHTQKAWDRHRPNNLYFKELKRVTRNQIIWGGNYFDLSPSRCWVVWYKMQVDLCMGDAEIAWTSFDRVIRVLSLHRSELWSEKSIHPTQKPVKLYAWLLSKFAKPGMTILDTHLGSGSIAIACHYFGAHLTACEIDQDYFTAACARIKRETAQATFGFDTTQKLPLAPDLNQGMIF